jgi:transcriptional accessory protein Tex/SPT6
VILNLAIKKNMHINSFYNSMKKSCIFKMFIYFPNFSEAPLKELRPGVEVRAVVFCVTSSFGMVVRLTDNIRGTLDITDMSDNYENLPLQGYKKGDIVTVRILKVDKFNKQAVVTMRLVYVKKQM